MSEETASAVTEYNLSNGTMIPSLSNHTLEMLQSKMLHNVLPAIYLFIFLVSTPLNLTCLCIFCRSQSKIPTMVFMINLTANDLVYGLTLPFLAVYHLRANNWPFGAVFCSATIILFYANVNCSILTMMCISVERYVGIVHPLRFQNCLSIRKACFICLLIWVLVLLIDSHLMNTKMTFFVRELNILTCFDILPKDKFSSTLFYLYFTGRMLAFFVIPILLMVICYLSIIVTLLRSQKTSDAKKKTIYTIAVLLIVLFICFVPSNLILIAHSLPSGQHYNLYVAYKFSVAVSGLNCCLDPFVYYFGSKEFQQNIKGKMHFLFHKNITENNMTTHTIEG